jgi:SAM-dependent methyltransferase
MSHDLVVRRLTTAAALAAGGVVLTQCRRPWGWLGRRVARTMNITHAGVTRWGLEHVDIDRRFRILDIGCGGGRTVRTLADSTDQIVCGVDYSAASAATARTTNADLIASGRVLIANGSVSQLPFAAGTFDLATAVETYYYWPDPVADLREVARVLKPGGRLVIIAETYAGRVRGALLALPMRLLGARHLTVEQQRAMFVAAGFTDIVIDTNPGKGWFCGVMRKAGLTRAPATD